MLGHVLFSETLKLLTKKDSTPLRSQAGTSVEKRYVAQMDGDPTRITRADLKNAQPEAVRRLARWLKMREIDAMSHHQLCRLLAWLFSRGDKRRRNLIGHW
jgi:hypothetical protein